MALGRGAGSGIRVGGDRGSAIEGRLSRVSQRLLLPGPRPSPSGEAFTRRTAPERVPVLLTRASCRLQADGRERNPFRRGRLNSVPTPEMPSPPGPSRKQLGHRCVGQRDLNRVGVRPRPQVRAGADAGKNTVSVRRCCSSIVRYCSCQQRALVNRRAGDAGNTPATLSARRAHTAIARGRSGAGEAVAGTAVRLRRWISPIAAGRDG